LFLISAGVIKSQYSISSIFQGKNLEELGANLLICKALVVCDIQLIEKVPFNIQSIYILLTVQLNVPIILYHLFNSKDQGAQAFHQVDPFHIKKPI